MRVIQGKYKGIYLEGFDLLGTRPTMDRVKESLFAILQPYLEDSCCLDLFSGSGNLGIEALSMGAKQVVFVDKNNQATKIIQKNLKKIQNNQTVLCLDYERALQLLKEERFDIIFLDPPYQTTYIKNSLEKIKEYDLLKNEGVVVCESDSLLKVVFDTNYYEIIKEKKYGDKYIRILKKK